MTIHPLATMPHSLAALQHAIAAATPDGAPSSDTLRLILQGLTVSLVSVTIKLLWDLREEFKTLKGIVIGPDGKNGLRSVVRDHTKHLAAIKERNDKIDAIVEHDAEQHPGPDRRRVHRRLRDQVAEDLLSHDEDTDS